MGWKRRAITVFDRLGGNRMVAGWFGRDRLTVLAYHRVTNHHSEGFVGFAGNVSASPEAFAEQMAWVARNATAVAMSDVVAAIDGDAPLPDRAVLITFDDGYRDNHDEALPILRAHGLPATIFLATDHIGSADPLWWDRAAWAFSRAEQRPDALSLVGSADWTDPGRAAAAWIETAKGLRHGEKIAALDELDEALRPPDPRSAFADAHLDWDQVRAMRAARIEFGAHTCTHPILTSLDLSAAAVEIDGSIERIESELGERPRTFAYPNGLEGDFDEAVVDAVSKAGISAAFTLMPGPARGSEVLEDPLRIRRVYVHHHDDLARFNAKVSGVARLLS